MNFHEPIEWSGRIIICGEFIWTNWDGNIFYAFWNNARWPGLHIGKLEGGGRGEILVRVWKSGEMNSFHLPLVVNVHTLHIYLPIKGNNAGHYLNAKDFGSVGTEVTPSFQSLWERQYLGMIQRNITRCKWLYNIQCGKILIEILLHVPLLTFSAWWVINLPR